MLSKETQIKILKETLDLLINKEVECGLCVVLRQKIRKICHLQNTLIVVENYIPLFKKSNAIKYANGREDGLFWWDFYWYDYKNRIKFINWIISELEKE